nr:MAG TPA: protein of unknown function DUF488 [Caudoviricetes sp.]
MFLTLLCAEKSSHNCANYKRQIETYPAGQ